MSDITLRDAYFSGIANEIALAKITGDTLSRKARKLWIYYLVIIFSVCRRRAESKNYIIVNGRAERKINLYDDDVRHPVYYGLVQKKLSELRFLYTAVSEFSVFERIRIACRAFSGYAALNDKEGKLIYWIDLCFWNEWVTRVKPESIKTYGHFDRLTTEISVLSQLYGYKFIIQQHGILGNKGIIEKKIHCDEVFAFNEIEVSNFYKNVIANGDCIFKIKYINAVDFDDNIEVFRPFRIGIVDQPMEGMLPLVDCIADHFPNEQIVVMLHPRTKDGIYHCIGKKNNIVVTRHKILDVDVLITISSTLFLDYLYKKYDKRIIVIEKSSILAEYEFIYHNISFISEIHTVIEVINKEIEFYKK